MRMSYQRQKEVLEMPNLIEVQKDSYKWFLDEGLKEVFDDISPIADYGGKFSLEFIDFTYDAKDAKYTIAQCKERDVTYAAPLKVRVRLINKETEEINEHEIFMGDLPLMTETGTFVINGAERVIVSQLVHTMGKDVQASGGKSGILRAGHGAQQRKSLRTKCAHGMQGGGDTRILQGAVQMAGDDFLP